MPLEKIIQKTIEYCKDRKAFGHSLLDNQVVHFRMAELQTEVEALRSTLYRATGQYDMKVCKEPALGIKMLCIIPCDIICIDILLKTQLDNY